jgi:hypothetical protein
MITSSHETTLLLTEYSPTFIARLRSPQVVLGLFVLGQRANPHALGKMPHRRR